MTAIVQVGLLLLLLLLHGLRELALGRPLSTLICLLLLLLSSSYCHTVTHFLIFNESAIISVWSPSVFGVWHASGGRLSAHTRLQHFLSSSHEALSTAISACSAVLDGGVRGLHLIVVMVVVNHGRI